MKILDIPQSGKRGLNVSQGGRYGQISRALVIPTNPRTSAQQSVRGIFAAQAARWRALNAAQRLVWTRMAARYLSVRRGGTSGPLTGSQLFNKLNCTLEGLGQAAIDAPVAKPQFAALAPQNLVITNTGGVIAIKLTTPADPGENTVLRAAAATSQGVNALPAVYLIGVCPAPVLGASDITALYTAKFGTPSVGEKVFVTACVMQDGWESIPASFSAIVPATT